MAKIFHASLYGLSKAKDLALFDSDIDKTEWSNIDIEASKFYLLIPQNSNLRQEYDAWCKITDIMTVNSTGVKTHRDNFVLDFDRAALHERICEFRDLNISDERIASFYELKDTEGWKLHNHRHNLANESRWENYFTKCLYRPFDFREYYHHTAVVERPRKEVMQHMLEGNNLGLIANRQVRVDDVRHFFVTEYIVENNFPGIANGVGYLFPLYRYPTTQAEKDMGMTRASNISPEFLTKLEQNFGYIPTPEAIFYYIYAIFNSPTYRTRYAEFLKIDFPRVPITRNIDLFHQLGELGEQLVNLHLMKSPILNQASSPFIDNGGGCIVDVGHPKYENACTERSRSGKVVINKQKDGFMDVPEAVWNFHVGGYQVCHKWLKDRKGRTLSQDDIEHYQKIVVALGQSIDLMAKIDAAIPNWPLDAEYN
jgi:predicted helicase